LTLDDLGSSDAARRLETLRHNEPVSWLGSLGGWLVTSRSLAREVLLPRDDVTVESTQNMVRASLGRMMLTVDEPAHGEMRGLFDDAFRPKAVQQRFSASCATLASSLIERWPDGEIELSHSFARPYAIAMAAQVIGLDLGQVDQMIETYDAFASAMEYSGDPEPLRHAEAARASLDTLLVDSLSRARPGASLAASVASLDGSSIDDVIDQLRVIMFGSIETIQASVLNTILLLGRNDITRRSLVERSIAVQAAVSESLRLIPPVAFVERWAMDDMEIGGVMVNRGEFIGVSVLGANHDPSVFRHPERFDVHRANAHQSLSFSFGTHHCLGFHLARLQTNVALERLMSRLGDFTLIDADEPEGFAFRKPNRVVVRAS
jgi:cytochrome P450